MHATTCLKYSAICTAHVFVFLGSFCVAAPDDISYARDISPLLSDRCFTCHGPDEEQRATDMRLDDPASTLEWAVRPGEPDASELVNRIFSTDADIMMPPPDSKLALSSSEKQLLRDWISQGAEFEKHWAFVTPVAGLPAASSAADTPKADDQQPSESLLPGTSTELASGNREPRTWRVNEIDDFVLSRLHSAGLTPSPMANRETLIRRLSLDLTGLPPSPGEVDAFVADKNPAAYERLVDRLLAKPSYGERMAVDWLDVARYADTHGYQADRYRAMWPWRDWVIQAFNKNMPYDEFITLQLAGDLLPDATPEQILATAFNRNHRQTNEGGSVEEEFRAEYVADRVNTFGAAFLGLTLECCRCHDHKYDPISQRDYYALSGFFNSIDESGLYSHFTDDTPTPALTLADDSQRSALSKLENQIAEATKALDQAVPSLEEYADWRAAFYDLRPSGNPKSSDGVEPEPERESLRTAVEASLKEGLIADYAFDELAENKLINRLDGTASGKTFDGPELVTGKVGNGLRLDGENNASFQAGGDFTRDQPFTISLWVKSPNVFDRAVIFHRSRAWTDAASRGYELLIEEGHLSAALINFWPGNAIRIVDRAPLPVNAWTHVVLAYDGSSRAAGLRLFVDGDEAEVDVIRDKLTRQIHGSEANELTIGQRFRDVGFKGGTVDELKVYVRRLSGLEIKALWLKDSAPANVAEFIHNAPADLLQEYSADHVPRLKQRRNELRKQLAELRRQRSELLNPIPSIMVMREEPEPRPTFVLVRGAYDAPGASVQRGVPNAIFPLHVDPQRAYPDRRDLAAWLTHPDHPLTARVAVNRFWQSLFGRGLVATSEDFGKQGARPSHPQLLDWLSRRFVDSGWNVKGLLKTIVMSATYRQASDPTAELLAKDPENELLARGPSMRLPAEMVRDAALASSGLLVKDIGGPSVKPFQPDGLWKEKSGESYRRDPGAGSRRRSIYTFWKRTSPPPAMMTFDASNREVCVVSRQTTMTPLQVLVLLNDPQMVEAAVALARQAMQSESVHEDRVRNIFRHLCGRYPSDRELSVLLQTFEEQRVPFDSDRELAKSLLTAGDQAVDAEDDDLASLAAYAVIAEGLMSFDGFVMKR